MLVIETKIFQFRYIIYQTYMTELLTENSQKCEETQFTTIIMLYFLFILKLSHFYILAITYYISLKSVFKLNKFTIVLIVNHLFKLWKIKYKIFLEYLKIKRIYFFVLKKIKIKEIIE
jgi:hypothetical protein